MTKLYVLVSIANEDFCNGYAEIDLGKYGKIVPFYLSKDDAEKKVRWLKNLLGLTYAVLEIDVPFKV